MLELPEVEVLRHDLDREIVDKRIKTVELIGTKAVEQPAKKQFVAGLEGSKVTAVERRADWLLIRVDTEEQVLLLRLGNHGHVRKATPKEPLAKDVSVVLMFSPSGQLRISDPKKESRILLVPTDEVMEVVGPVGMDPAADPVSWDRFGALLYQRDGRLKNILMDPTFIGGIGMMYSDEILFHAGLRFDREPRSLSPQEIRRLHRSVVEVVHEAIKYGGTTLDEEGFTNLEGKRGTYGDHLAVFKRDGRMSPRSRGPIVKARFGNHYTYFCEQTQV